MMAETVDDLMWDYTGDDSSPFLQRATSPSNRSEKPCGISRRQARYLYHSMSEAAQILEAELHRDRLNNDNTNNTASSSFCDRFVTKFGSFLEKISHINFAYIPLALSILLIVVIVSESVWDAAESNGNHLPYVAAVLSTLCGLLVIILYAVILLRLSRRGVALSTLTVSFLCSLFTFAAVYTVFIRFNRMCWGLIPTSKENFIITYCRMLQFSVSVFTLNSGNVAPGVWYAELVVSLQMIVAYCHLVLIISTTVSIMQNARKKSVLASAGEASNRPLVRFDVDNDSVDVFDMRSETTNELEQRSARPSDGRLVQSGMPTDVPPQTSNNLLSDADDDLLLSHSI